MLIIGRTINRSSNPVKSIQKIIKDIENELKKPKLKFVVINNSKSAKASKDSDFVGFVFYQKSPRFIMQ